MDNKKAERGREILRRLSDSDDPLATFPDEFGRHTLEHLFGDIWTSDGMSLEERSLVTCTILTALGRENELRFHFAAARAAGVFPHAARSSAMITHAAHYAGWPNGVGASRSLREVWPEDD